MLEVYDAYQLIQNNRLASPTSRYELSQANSKILNQDILADRNYPPFDRVMMDGIAINLSSLDEGRKSFYIENIFAAGQSRGTLLNTSNCVEIMTGAPLPRGADCVIPYEEISIQGEYAKLKDLTKLTSFQNIHPQGSDIKKGDIILSAGLSVQGPRVGILASVGASEISCLSKPRVNIISTGDELVSITEIPLEHQIRRSNSYALASSLSLYGYDDIEFTHLDDNPEEIDKHFRSAIQIYDLLIYSGGVSKGKFDYLPSIWTRNGAQKIFHGVAQRPGKPMWFGVHEESQTQIYGLPGNPVSSLICLHRYFLEHKPIYVELTQKIEFKKELTYFLPVQIESSPDGKLKATPVIIKNSGEFSALAQSDGFIELPKEQSVFRTGEVFSYFSWKPL